ncbi:hypothetical protein SRB5_62250 [Streptomyces sp. RB5]|uniref:Uncharacterized protein n=1 Tax=Streptomyces smaragdinus TaxID=2585196 RepID=A0A7K0CRQ9_9ACTN|nr:hypothetical protein [Streptomyces smaragdinus]MQY16033.1 hypothetical protein [Streptomyces smaragdinus]
MKRMRATLTGRGRAVVRAMMGVCAAAGLVVLGAGPASAAPVPLDYPITGVTHLAGTDSDLNLGPGTLKMNVDLNAGTITGNTIIPPATGSFKTFDLLPVTATTEFVETEPTTGTISTTGQVNTTSKIKLRITSLKILGIPQLIGPWCETEVPATINLQSQPGFSPFLGGDMAGTYTIPKFEHCLLLTPVINLLIPSDGNTISLTLGRAQAGS